MAMKNMMNILKLRLKIGIGSMIKQHNLEEIKFTPLRTLVNPTMFTSRYMAMETDSSAMRMLQMPCKDLP
jgi:hypothetical protein